MTRIKRLSRKVSWIAFSFVTWAIASSATHETLQEDQTSLSTTAQVHKQLIGPIKLLTYLCIRFLPIQLPLTLIHLQPLHQSLKHWMMFWCVLTFVYL